VRSRIQLEDARTQEALFTYEQTLLDALREVEDNMVFYMQEKDRRESLRRSAEAAAKSVELVNTLYVTGLTDFQNVQDQESRKAQQDDQFFQSEGQVASFLIGIYRSLGGGWAPASAQPVPPAATTSSTGPTPVATSPATPPAAATPDDSVVMVQSPRPSR
jgi:outer membrane protein TolC